MAALQTRLGVTFRNEAYLHQALRHRSAVLDRPLDSNERLEFLGDSIVGMILCDVLLSLFPEAREGELAKAKAFLASESVLAEAGLALGLDAVVEMSAGEEATGGRSRRSILADTFEAVIGAIYLDRGLRAAHRVVRKALREPMEQVARDEHERDFKSLLQERLQAQVRRTPIYRIVTETGADHDKTFVAHALLGRKVIGEGAGKSKKQAEQAAAHAALENAIQIGKKPVPSRSKRSE